MAIAPILIYDRHQHFCGFVPPTQLGGFYEETACFDHAAVGAFFSVCLRLDQGF
jgi:hypothetical protein